MLWKVVMCEKKYLRRLALDKAPFYRAKSFPMRLFPRKKTTYLHFIMQYIVDIVLEMQYISVMLQQIYAYMLKGSQWRARKTYA